MMSIRLDKTFQNVLETLHDVPSRCPDRWRTSGPATSVSPDIVAAEEGWRTPLLQSRGALSISGRRRSQMDFRFAAARHPIESAACPKVFGLDVTEDSCDEAREERSCLRLIDLFAGAGGLSLGLHAAGFSPVAAVEIDRDACDTYAALLSDADLLPTAIERIDFRKYRNRVDVVAGGPPCQPFSSGGKRRGEADARNGLPEFLRAVKEIQPVAFLMENVPGLTQGSACVYFDSFVDEIRDLGYSVACDVLNAADYGVPQKRRRLFVVGLRGAMFTFPSPTHGPEVSKPHVSASAIISRDGHRGDENPSRIIYAKRPDLRPSPYDGHLFNGGGRPIDLSKPCPTILASAGGNKTHFVDTQRLVPDYHAQLRRGGRPRTGALTGGRRLTVQESAAVQTFPRRARFFGSRSSQYSQVGNAVPPRLALVIGRALYATLTTPPSAGKVREARSNYTVKSSRRSRSTKLFTRRLSG